MPASGMGTIICRRLELPTIHTFKHTLKIRMMKIKTFRTQSFLSLVLFLAACSSLQSAVLPSSNSGTPNYSNTLVSLTFDDGDADNFSARAVLVENNLHATWYIVSSFIGAPGYLTAGQLHLLAADGNEIGGHSLTHPDLTTLSGRDLRVQVCQGRLDLLALGFQPVSFAYPFGHFDPQSRQAVVACGYNSARTVIDGPDTVPPADPFTIRSMPYIVKDTRLPKMQRYVTEAVAGGGGWVIFVFHHICTACDQYSIDPPVFAEFAAWLASRQELGLSVKTVREVIGGDVQPGVEP